MTETDPSRRGLFGASVLHRISNAVFITAVAVVIVCLLSLAFAGGENSSAVSVSVSDMQRELRTIGDFATACYTYSGVGDWGSSRQLFGINIPLTDNRRIFSYTGSITAGYRVADIRLSVDDAEGVIYVSLPQAEVLSNHIDVGSIVFLYTHNNIFNSLRDSDMQAVLVGIEADELEQAASAGLYTQTEASAQSAITAALSAFEGYRVVFCSQP